MRGARETSVPILANPDVSEHLTCSWCCFVTRCLTLCQINPFIDVIPTKLCIITKVNLSQTQLAANYICLFYTSQSFLSLQIEVTLTAGSPLGQSPAPDGGSAASGEWVSIPTPDNHSPQLPSHQDSPTNEEHSDTGVLFILLQSNLKDARLFNRSCSCIAKLSLS